MPAMSRLAVALLALVTWAHGYSLDVSNPSFEKAHGKDKNLPAGWGVYASPGTTATFKRDTTTAHSGEASAYFSNQGPMTALWSTRLQCMPGLSYTVEVWVKMRNATGRTGVSIRFLDEDKNWLGGPIFQPNPLVGTMDWTKVVYKVDPPPGAGGVVVFLSNTNSKGAEVWYDDISIKDDFEEIVPRSLGDILKALQAASASADLMSRLGLDSANVKRSLLRARGLKRRIDGLKGEPTIEVRRKMVESWRKLTEEVRASDRALDLVYDVAKWGELTGESQADYILGWQDAMNRVWLREKPANFDAGKTGRIVAIRGEVEPIQLVVAAIAGPLKDVRVTVGDFAGPGGATIPSAACEINVVGYVRITRPTFLGRFPVESEHPGWWPDILLPNFPFEVARADSQSVWLSVTIPEDARPGLYRAPVVVKPEGGTEKAATLDVEVRNVTLPATWHFRSIMSFHDAWGKRFYEEAWTPELRRKFLDFLLDRRINLTSMYGATDFSKEEIERGMARGQNTILLYTISSSAGLKQAPWIAAHAEKRARKTLDEWVPWVKERGWFEQSLFYGYDELPAEWFESMKHTFLKIKKGYDGIPTTTTAYDESYGLDTGLTGAVDIWIPYMTRYHADVAARAREKGTKVWWYDTRWTIEQYVNRGRLIPWQTFKVKADGYLIWCINRWRGEGAPKLPKAQWKTNTRPVALRVLNEWDPWLDGVTPNSSAMLLYPGPDGPYSSLRLENFRDGLEDYDLLVTAQALAEKTADPKVAAQLRSAITIEDEFIRDAVQTDYRSETLKAHRLRLIEALEAAGCR